MKKFDIDAALRGEEVITRNGRKVVLFNISKDRNATHPINFVYEDEDGEYVTETARVDGVTDAGEYNDLFMAPKVQKFYININKKLGIIYQSPIYSSEDMAQMHSDPEYFIKRIEFEVKA
jgi:hypothetical protein